MDLVAKALAKSVYDGDIVNLRLLFSPFSPARVASTEQLESFKYAYLLPDEEQERDEAYGKALELVREADTWAHIGTELEANRPAQIPWQLLLMLGDRAVRAGKYTSASQAYEMLRIRPRMQEEFLRQADAALDSGDVARAVHGYLVATGLAYNYAAFPEPLPVVQDFQTRALMLHGEYPERPEDAVGMLPAEAFVDTALTYLLLDAQVAGRLKERPLDVRLAFLGKLVEHRDPNWRDFVHRYREARKMAEDMERRFGHTDPDRADSSPSLAEEIAEQEGDDPSAVSAHLLGRSIPQGEWWQYLKELAFEHPPAALFVARQIVGETEILVPRCRADSPVPKELRLLPADGVSGEIVPGPE